MCNAKALELQLRLTYLVLSRFVYLSSKRITINRFYFHNSIQYETLITKTFYKIRYFVTKGKIRNINCLYRIDHFLIPCVQFDATTMTCKQHPPCIFTIVLVFSVNLPPRCRFSHIVRKSHRDILQRGIVNRKFLQL